MPDFQHDCTGCKFLGHFAKHDLYFCGDERFTVIARYGDDGPDYVSGWPSSLPILKVAAAMAEVKGFIPAK